MSKSSKTAAADKATGQTIVIGGQTYNLEDLNEDARRQVGWIAIADDHIRELDARLAIARTARANYIYTLENSLKQGS